MPERLQNSLNVPDAAVWIRYNRNPGNRISLAPNSSKRMMPRRLPVWLSLVLIGLAIILQGCAHQRAAVPEDGAALFAKKCAECHQEDPDNDMRAPTPQALRLMSRSAILASLETGRMRWEAKFLSKAKKTAIANYLGAPDVT
ncbi:MAG: c-type cytochrome, partial [Candidatus Acidiferrales bacterium]